MDLLIRILIAIGVIYLAQVVIGWFALKEPANKIIFGLVLLLVIYWLITGQVLLR